MVLLASAVCTKTGKTIVSRQFVEMTKARIEGLLAAFPKLMSTEKRHIQHTFVETDSVRYVYQPLDKLYMLLITTKTSNILEDLETLRLFSKVVLDCCKMVDESEVSKKSFDLIFAFDEIVALGYRESVNLAQVRTFVEMDSHEEKMYQAVRQSQERDAKVKMREKAKELQRQRIDAVKKGVRLPTSSSSPYMSMAPVAESIYDIKVSKPEPLKYSSSNKALKLGAKSKDVDLFVDQLKSEGEKVVPLNKKPTIVTSPASIQNDVHIKKEERLIAVIGRDGGVRNFELHGLISLKIANEKYQKIVLQFNDESGNIPLQTHPNVDKELFKNNRLIGLKNPSKPFPLESEVGLLKWTLQSQEESAIPLSINCWPSENGYGGCDVNIEYNLEHVDLELNNVTVTIPLPFGNAPVIQECNGVYSYEPKKNILIWSIAVVDSSNSTGSIEFESPKSTASDFFPIKVDFISKSAYNKIKPVEIKMVDDNTPIKFSSETSLFTGNYEII
ncbi:coatomer subunit delta [Daktulosphaira vitifoliae]|uniref:coatomer subunit delta n=1 Tax=Daktulosphaira vitifoliae TaxID=58002 RepID=UPI0021A9A9C7|nr:coatomer subunit delta [Daktulosphaira vitifoliae]